MSSNAFGHYPLTHWMSLTVFWTAGKRTRSQGSFLLALPKADVFPYEG